VQSLLVWAVGNHWNVIQPARNPNNRDHLLSYKLEYAPTEELISTTLRATNNTSGMDDAKLWVHGPKSAAVVK